ncbi:MAG TPA: glycosyltransferase [Chitinophagaceae bacterium]|nr:glycosyltransferase [Chitinophagaceae bacterium]
MLSLIICARQADIPDVLKENIRQTIGASYELIVIDNSAGRLNIFQAYNEGVRRSTYPLLLFMHDDIIYHTPDWGKLLISHFNNAGIGAAGIAGTPYLPVSPGGWWSTGIGYLYLLQSESAGKPASLQNYSCPVLNNREVVALDGVWFCIRRTLFEHIRFDDETYKGFHFYDIDTTLQVFKAGYKLLSINDILIHHTSAGRLNDSWVENLSLFRQKWAHELPVSCIRLSAKQRRLIEYRVINTFISDQLKIFGDTKKNRRKAYLQAIRHIMACRDFRSSVKTPFWIARFFYSFLKNL